MDIGGGHIGVSGTRKLKWQIHNRHLLMPAIHTNVKRTVATQRNVDSRTQPAGFVKVFEDDNADEFMNIVKNINQIYRPKSQTPLHRCGEKNTVKIAAKIVSQGGHVNARDLQGRTPLYLAAKSNSVAVMKVLVEQGFASLEMPDTMSAQGLTPLHVAACCDNVEAVQYLLSQGANINSHDLHCSTPLVSACKLLGDPKCTGKAVMCLVEKGADVNYCEGWVTDPKDKAGVPKAAGMTALHYAAMYDRANIVEFMLKHGAQTNIRDDLYQKTALEFAKNNNAEKTVQVIENHNTQSASSSLTSQKIIDQSQGSSDA